MKGYYGIYCLANRFDFDGAMLTKALKKTFENRGHAFTVGQSEQVIGFGNMDSRGMARLHGAVIFNFNTQQIRGQSGGWHGLEAGEIFH